MKQRDLSSMSTHVLHDDEIDLRELFAVMWRNKLFIILVAFVFTAFGVIFAKFQPNIYRAEALISPNSGQQSGSLGKLAGQFGGLASLAGINLGGGGGGDAGVSLATLQSRKFLSEFIRRYQLEAPLIATKKWDRASGQVVFDPEIYSDGQWVRPAQKGRSQIPTNWELYKEFLPLLGVAEEKDTGFITLSIEHQSPKLAQQWVMLLIDEINAWKREDTIREAKRNIEFLNQQLEKTKIASMQEVFHQLIEEQIKNLMLAEVNPDAAFKVIDPAVVPEEKAKPQRALIVILATLLGGMLAIMIVLIRHFCSKAQEKEQEPMSLNSGSRSAP